MQSLNNKNWLLSILGISIATIILFQNKISNTFHNYLLEGTKLKIFSVKRLSGEEISLPSITQNKVLFFWSKECPPCKLELDKLNSMISKGDLNAEKLIAVSIDNDKEKLINTVEERKYQFLIAVDDDSSLVRKFSTVEMPTVLFINKNSNIDWVSSGTHWNIEKKIKEFLLD